MSAEHDQIVSMIREMLERYQRDPSSAPSLNQLYRRAQLAGIAPEASFAYWSRIYRRLRREMGISRRLRRRVYDDTDPMGLTPLDEVHAVDYKDLSPNERAVYNFVGARRLAMAVLASAWADAGKRASPMKDNATQAPSMVVRYAQAWLQTPGATAIWCEILDIDPELVASLSRRRHGRPTFSKGEILEHESERRRN